MNAEQIQADCDRIAEMMVAKGLVEPEVTAMIRSCDTPIVMTQHRKPGPGHERDCQVHRGENLSWAMSEAMTAVAALPPPEERHRGEFLRLNATAADYGKAHGIDAEFVNPLLVEMKRLSANAIAAE